MKRVFKKTLSLAMAVVLGVGSINGLSNFNIIAKAEQGTEVKITDDELSQLYSVQSENVVSVHDPSIVVGKDNKGEKCYYIFGSHLAWAKSYDLVTWSTFTNNINSDYKTLFSKEIAWSALGNAKYDPAGNMWAPDVIWNESIQKWCMYMSINGIDWNSTIALLTADSLEGNWTYVGTVIYSGFGNDAQDYTLTDYKAVTGDTTLASRYLDGTNWNFRYGAHAIDPCVFYDEDGILWMSYGSWSGGIYMIQLDETTGFRDSSVTYNYVNGSTDPYMGIKLGGSTASGEASYIEYINGYYYMFITYGGLMAAGGYNMRIFRSADVTGPYTDISGDKALNGGVVQGTIGTRLMTYYKWSFWQNAQVAQGHNSAFVDDDGNAYVIYHTRTNDGTEGHYVRTHQLFTTENGYLVAAPFQYNTTDTTSISEVVTGDYEVIMHTSTDFAALGYAAGSKITLNTNGTISGAYTGTWNKNDNNITMTIANVTYEGVLVKQTIEGSNIETVCFTAVGTNDTCIWGAKYPEDAVAVAWNATNMNTIKSLPQIAFDDISFADSLWGCNITWQSSNTDVIGNDGTFTTPDVDTDVTISMTITKGDCIYEKDYVITAKADLDKTDDKYLVAKYLTDKEVDLTNATAGTYTFRNLFNQNITHGLDISNGISIKFDAELKGNLKPLSTILSFTGGGKLYFTGCSYLGYNANGKYIDANLLNYNTSVDYIGKYNKVTVELQITAAGFEVYVNDKFAYSNETLANGTTKGSGDLTNYNDILNWLSNDATTLNFGSGSWWTDQNFEGTISNVELYAMPVEKIVNNATFIYNESYNKASSADVTSYWPTINKAAEFKSSNDDHKTYMSFTPGAENSRAIVSTLPAVAKVSAGNSISVDAKLTAGSGSNCQQSEFAIASTDKKYYSNTANNGLESGYLVLLTSTNSTTWVINGTSKTVVIPKNTWVNIKAYICDNNTVDLTITSENDGTVLFNGNVAYNGNGTIDSIYIRGGRYNADIAVDNILVYASRTPAVVDSANDIEEILADYDFTNSNLPNGIGTEGEVLLTDEGAKLVNSYLILPSDMFVNLSDNAKALNVEITFSKQNSWWPENQWSERLFCFTSDNDGADGVQVEGANGLSLSFNGNLGTTKSPYSASGSYLDGSLGGKIALDTMVTVKAVLDFETNIGYVYLNDELMGAATSTDTITVADVQNFIYNRIGNSPDMWSMWGFMTVANLKVSETIVDESAMEVIVSQDFARLNEGYTTENAAVYTITNTGNNTLNNIDVFLLNGEDFTLVTDNTASTLEAGESTTVTVITNSGLLGSATPYTDKLIVLSDLQTAVVKVSQKVITKALAGVINPAPTEPDEETTTEEVTTEETEEITTKEETTEEETTEEVTKNPSDIVSTNTITENIKVPSTVNKTVNSVKELANYNFTGSNVPLGVTLGTGAEATAAGIKLANGFIELPSNLFATLPNNADKLNVEIRFSKQATFEDWTTLQWSERLFNFASDNDSTNGVQVAGTNGFGLSFNGNLGTTKYPYVTGDAYLDSSLGGKIEFDTMVTVKMVLDFKTNTGYVYLNGELMGSSTSKDTITVKDLQSFIYNRIGQSTDMWSMWGFMTVENFKVSANYDTTVATQTEIHAVKTTETTLYQDGSQKIVTTVTDTKGNVLSKETKYISATGEVETEKETETSSDGTTTEENTTALEETTSEETTSEEATSEEEITSEEDKEIVDGKETPLDNNEKIDDNKTPLEDGDKVKTGDSNNGFIFVLAGLVSTLAVGAVVLKKKENEEENV